MWKESVLVYFDTTTTHITGGTEQNRRELPLGAPLLKLKFEPGPLQYQSRLLLSRWRRLVIIPDVTHKLFCHYYKCEQTKFVIPAEKEPKLLQLTATYHTVSAEILMLQTMCHAISVS